MCYTVSRLKRLEEATDVVEHDSHEMKWDSNRIPVDNVARFTRSLSRGRVGGLPEKKKFPCIKNMFDVFSILTNITSVTSLDMSVAVGFCTSV